MWAQNHINGAAEVIHVDSDTSPKGKLRFLYPMTRCRHHIIATITLNLLNT